MHRRAAWYRHITLANGSRCPLASLRAPTATEVIDPRD